MGPPFHYGWPEEIQPGASCLRILPTFPGIRELAVECPSEEMEPHITAFATDVVTMRKPFMDKPY